MTYQYELIITNDNLNALLKEIKSNNEIVVSKININDYIFKKKCTIKDDKCLQIFKYYYNKYNPKDILNLSQLLLASFHEEYKSNNPKLRIPLHNLDIDNKLSVFDTPDDFDKKLQNMLKQDTKTVYYCNDIKDLIISSIFHYLQNNYRLKKCPICNNWFLENINAKIKYCDFNKIDDEKKCTKKANSIRELARRKNNPDVALHKLNQEMLSRRKSDEKSYNEYMDKYNKIIDVYDKKRLTKWLQEQHDKYLIRRW